MTLYIFYFFLFRTAHWVKELKKHLRRLQGLSNLRVLFTLMYPIYRSLPRCMIFTTSLVERTMLVSFLRFLIISIFI